MLSGKGGVGKSTVSAQLSRGLALNEDVSVALLDIDICGPSIPTIMGVAGEQVMTTSLMSNVYQLLYKQVSYT